MGVVTVKSTAITAADQQYPRSSAGPYLSKGSMYTSVGTLEVGASDSAGSIYRFCRISSSARLHELKIFSNAIDGFTSAQVGVYAIQNSAGTAGGAVDEDLFGATIDLSAAQTEPYDVIFNNLGIENVEKRIWELLGLTADPFCEYDICVTSVTQSGGAGTLSMILAYTI